MAKKIKFPRTMFQLTAAMNVREITLTGPAKTGSRWGNGERYGYAEDAKGKQHYLAWLYDTREAAIAAGEVKMADQEARLAKLTANVARRRAGLNKAKGVAA